MKPANIAAHRKLEAVAVGLLDDEALLLHLHQCLDHVERTVEMHHVFTAPCCAPVGDFLAHAQSWTGKAPSEFLQVLRGSIAISNGPAAAELATLVASMRENAEPRRAFEAAAAAAPAAALVALESVPGAVGEAAKAYLGLVRHRCLGYDVTSKTGADMPAMLVRTIRAALEGASATANTSDAATLALREAVPSQHRPKFDELLTEARLVNRLRDERGHFCDGWAMGIARLGLLEAGRRLLARGKVSSEENAADLTHQEIGALLRGGSSPSREVIAERERFRLTRSANDPDVPAWLGAPPSSPPPAEWLPAHGRRAQRAIVTFIETLFNEPVLRRTTTSVRGVPVSPGVYGVPVSPGVYVGRARVVADEADFGRIEKGDVLVTRATSPYFNVVLPLLGAIVTDRGGALCHAAIVSREYGIPGVVGTREGTQLIQDGAKLRVDGDVGLVEVVE